MEKQGEEVARRLDQTCYANTRTLQTQERRKRTSSAQRIYCYVHALLSILCIAGLADRHAHTISEEREGRPEASGGERGETNLGSELGAEKLLFRVAASRRKARARVFVL